MHSVWPRISTINRNLSSEIMNTHSEWEYREHGIVLLSVGIPQTWYRIGKKSQRELECVELKKGEDKEIDTYCLST